MRKKDKIQIGDVFETTCGVDCVVIGKSAGSSEQVTIKWQDEAANEVDVSLYHLLTGRVQNPSQQYDVRRKYNQGDTFFSPVSGLYTITDIQDSLNVEVQFENTGAVCVFPARSVVRLEVHDPLLVTIHGVGYIGIGKFNSINEGKRAYPCWLNMLARCYDEKDMGFVAYGARGVHVDPVWFNFQNFAAWYSLEFRGYKLELDKDIIVPGNLCYGPATCAAVPRYINNIISNKAGTIASGLVGVRKYTEKYILGIIRDGGKTINLGRFSSESEAHVAWQKAKANVLEALISKYAKEPFFNTRVADGLMQRVWKLRLDAHNGCPTTSI